MSDPFEEQDAKMCFFSVDVSMDGRNIYSASGPLSYWEMSIGLLSKMHTNMDKVEIKFYDKDWNQINA